jgi:2-polyprenyl-3-methyl-5-hydroxy-6-metoxy-1,4-benzoquinol methylase
MSSKEWFAEWFDSSYYHLLYQHRDAHEAQCFIEKLMTYLQVPKGSRVLDLACGKGRHSLTLAQLGYEVVGADLAPSNIAAAQQEAQNLQAQFSPKFIVHDMRKPSDEGPFSAILNLFTSFGYFDSIVENQAVCDAIACQLAPKGLLVVDFLNAPKVLQNLVLSETILREKTTFYVKRWATDTHIFKKIEFTDQQGQDQQFTERVQALQLKDFESLLQDKFDIIDVFGNYQLEPYVGESSERLLLVARLK